MASDLSSRSFDLNPPPRVSFGVDAVGKLGRRVKALGKGSVLLVTDAGLVGAGVAARVVGPIEDAGVAVRVFDGVRSNPDVACVSAGAEALREQGDAVVVAVGGGSALDAAKAIALIGPNGGTVRDWPFGSKPPLPAAPLVAVPTTAGTGAETNMFAVIVDPEVGRKVLLAHPSTLPVAVVLDPALTTRAPSGVTAACGMDALTHALEALGSQRANPYTDAMAREAIGRVARFLPRAVARGDDLEARAELLLAAHLAGYAFGSSGLGLCHAMGHPLGARLDVPHGQSLATLLPAVLRYNLPVVAERYASLAPLFGVPESGSVEARGVAVVAAVERLRAEVRTDRPVASFGASRELLPTLVEDALSDPLMLGTPRVPTPGEVQALYEASW